MANVGVHLYTVSQLDCSVPEIIRAASDAGFDGVEFIDRFGSDAVPIVHLKDVEFETESDMELGTGDADMRSVVNASLDAGVDWLVYEYEQPADPVASLSHRARTIVDYLDER